jgi:hypothetical protein
MVDREPFGLKTRAENGDGVQKACPFARRLGDGASTLRAGARRL